MSNECAVYLQMFNEQPQFFKHLFLGKWIEFSPLCFLQQRRSREPTTLHGLFSVIPQKEYPGALLRPAILPNSIKPFGKTWNWISATSREDHYLILSDIIAEPVPTCRISIIAYICHRDGHGNVGGYSIKSISEAHRRRSRHTGDGFDCETS